MIDDVELPDCPLVDEQEIVHPLTGECLSSDNMDGLIDCYESIRGEINRLSAAKAAVTAALLAWTERQQILTRTRRVAGSRRTAKLEMPDAAWDQSVLKEAWHSFPSLRDQLLRIERLGVKITEFKKAIGTASTEPAFQAVVSMIVEAERPPRGLPQVTIEK